MPDAPSISTSSTERTYQCVHCKDMFKSPKRLRLVDRYCPYCDAVVRGTPDKSWISKVRSREVAGNGFHRIAERDA